MTAGAALAVTGPTCLWVIAGAVLRRIGWFSDRLIETGSRLIFRYALPVVLFFAASRADYSRIAQARYLLAGLLATVLIVFLAELFGRLRGMPRAERAVFVQGAYRANLGVIGIALCANAYGDEGLALAALPLASMTVLYNIIAVLLLNSALGGSVSPRVLLLGIVRNPLIIGISLGVLCSGFSSEIPSAVYALGSGFSAIVLPFALLAIGASMNLRAIRGSGRIALQASFWKLLLAPLLTVALAVMLGVRGTELGVLFLLSAAPTAAASFVMVVAAGGNGALAANIVVVTTLLSAFSLTVGIVFLRVLGLI